MQRAYAQPRIRQAGSDDADAVSDILTEAFADDPVMNWMFAGARPIRRFFREVTADIYLTHGFGHIVDDSAAALWLPPFAKAHLPLVNELRLDAAIFLQGGVSAVQRAQQTAKTVLSGHPEEPHYYLFAVGVRKARQGRGLGGGVIRAGLEKVDEAGNAAYLENSKACNTPLYERLGFRTIAPVNLPDGAPPLLGMLRSAKGGTP